MLRADLVAVVGEEVSDHLLAVLGPRAIRTERRSDGLWIEASDATDAELTSALASFAPTSTGADPLTWQPAVPAFLATHLVHLRDYRAAVRAGTQSAKTAAVRQAEAEHVLADLIDAVRFLNRRATGD